MSANEKIILASTFHGISGIAAQLTPAQLCGRSPLDFIRPRGITAVEAQKFKLYCFNTPTGLKFLLIVTPNLAPQTAENLCKKTYELFCDYVLKNPFYDTDMPVRCAAFEKEIKKLFADYVPSSDGPA